MDFAKSTVARISFEGLKPEDGLSNQRVEIIVFLAAMFILPFVLLKLMRRPKLKLPPSPPAYPIIGHLHLLGKLPHHSIANIAKTYGEIYSLRLGSVPAIVVTTPEMAKEFLLTHDKIWASRTVRDVSGYYLSYNHTGIAFAPFTPVWRNLRKICTSELFTQKRMEASQGVRDVEMQCMISILNDANQRRLIDLKLEVNALTANVVTRMVLNKRFMRCVDSTAEEESRAQQFKEIMKDHFTLQGIFMIGDYIPWLRPLDLGGKEKRMKALRKRLDAFLNEILDDHEVKRAKGPIAEEDQDMIDVLLNEMHQQDPNEPHKMDLNNIKSTILNMFAGGTDTATITIEWAMSELLRNPPIMAKLKAELDALIGQDRRVRETDVPNLPYLQAITKETFRLHPAGPLLVPHESTHDCEVAGYRIPAGTRLFVNIYAIGRSSKAWDRPLEFDPERFMTGPDASVDTKGKHYRLLPFGTGRRGCPGMSLGLLLVQFTLAALVHALDWSLPPGMDPEDVDMTEACGLKVPREHALSLNAKPRAAAQFY
ncbi:flavonoid 3'-monooxygenase isoform X2 [Physcomitrium patens]|uniref:flavonoid 3'-monooxygenase isoform X2 n=1 Tax=Physcomitrium patens TaxID=3218 RepID=UPI000D15A8A6|nr:cytochrome P450 71A1-like isoform X2 [Physcomitrium patens]|eukprot:XP_024400329.1 cytochrome P450 71A1-like isoform X2 [Physcomitrella patens]